jgi:tetratricopeptide (TPR) repeat protein
MIKKDFINLKLLLYFLVFNHIIIPSLLAQNNTEITLTVDNLLTTETSLQFDTAEKLRKELKFNEAIKEYEKVVNSKEDTRLKPEAAYDIGLCYTWLNDLENARLYFTKVINEYKTDQLAVSFSQYGLSWIKVKEGKYYEAIEILEKELNSKNCNDYEHNAVMLFGIGKIYQNWLLDFEKADEIYRQLIINYPDAKIINHPFLNYLRKN